MLVMIVPALLTVAVRFGIPESPLYLASVGRYAEADAIIARLVERTGADVREWTHEAPATAAAPASPDEPESPGVPPATSSSAAPAPKAEPSVSRQLRAASGQLVQLWQHSAKTTLVSWSLFVSVLLVYYAALTWLPGILKKQGMADQAAFLVTGSMTAVGILGVIASALIVERFGRKVVLGVSSIIAAVLLVGAAVFIEASGANLTFAAKATIIGFGFVIQIAIPTLYTYVSELYPTRLRGSGFGWASAASRLATGIAPIVFGAFMWPVLGLTLTFILTGALVVIAVVLMSFMARETTGEELS